MIMLDGSFDDKNIQTGANVNEFIMNMLIHQLRK